jgi:hypothetical protein
MLAPAIRFDAASVFRFDDSLDLGVHQGAEQGVDLRVLVFAVASLLTAVFAHHR